MVKFYKPHVHVLAYQVSYVSCSYVNCCSNDLEALANFGKYTNLAKRDLLLITEQAVCSQDTLVF